MNGGWRRRTGKVALLVALATAAPALMGTGRVGSALAAEAGPTSPPPSAQNDLSIAATGTTGGWCVRGATFSVLFSAAFSLPGIVTGIGAPYTAGRAAVAAVAGCGFAVAWRTMALAVAYIDGLVHPPLPLPPYPDQPRRGGRDPSLVETTG